MKISTSSIQIAASLVLAASGQNLPFPSKFPASYPSIDQDLMISSDRLIDPVIVEAINYVKSVVPAAILALPVSTFNPSAPSAPTYHGDAAANCYWPTGQCLRSADSASYKADISECPKANDWGLTYDDGPIIDATYGTAQLLAALNAANALKATFFIVGSNAIQAPSILKDMDAAGHELALHTFTHHPLTALTNEQIVAELQYNMYIIFNATGKVPINFRPPYGDIDDRVRAIVTALGYRSVLWTYDSDDTSSNPITAAPPIIRTFFTSKAGFITLQHDITPITTKIAIDALVLIKLAAIVTKPQPVARCLGVAPANWYKIAGGNANVTSPVSQPRNSSVTAVAGRASSGMKVGVDASSLFIGFITAFGMALFA